MQSPNILTFPEFDPKFKSILEKAKGHSLLNPYKCWNLYQFAQSVGHLHGEMAEVGVYRGGGAKVICTGEPNKKLHLFDTFKGMPKVDPKKDMVYKGQFNDTSVERVKKHLSGCDVEIYQGLFPQTAMTNHINGPFCFVHVDVDLYSSTKAAFEYFCTRMVRGGIILCDDYGSRTCPGAKKAVDEFFQDKKRNFITLATGQALYIR